MRHNTTQTLDYFCGFQIYGMVVFYIVYLCSEYIYLTIAEMYIAPWNRELSINRQNRVEPGS